MLITDRYSKYSTAVSLKKPRVNFVAAAVFNSWFFPLGIPNSVLTDNRPKFVSAFFEYICGVLGVKRVAITAYHRETNGQTEQYNKAFEGMIRLFYNDHQIDWDMYVQPLT